MSRWIASGGGSGGASTASINASPRALGSTWAFQGDSITGLWFPAFTGILARQRIAYDESLVFSHSGFTTTQLAALTSEVINATPKPQVVFLQMGANDAIGGVALSVFRTNITAIVAAYRAAGIIPVIGTVLPQGNTSFRARIREYNAWLKEFCTAQQITLVDLYSALVDHTTGAPATGMLNTSDNLHPVSAGSRAMGLAIATAADPLLPVVAPPVAVDAADATNLFGTSGFATADTNADGIPNGWTPTGAATGWTHSIVTDAAANGRWIRMVGSGAGAARTLVPNDLTTGFAPGNKMRLSARVRCSGQTATTSEFSLFVQVYSAGYASTLLLKYAVPALTAAVDGIASLPFTVPTGGAIIGTFFSAGPGNGTYEIADVTMTNLTTLGL